MKKFLVLFAFAGLLGAVHAQSTSTAVPAKEKAAKVEEKHGCAGHGDAKAACCAGKAGAKAQADATKATDANAAEATAPKAGCCAGKSASAKKSCHGDDAKADAGAMHDHAEMKEHACTEACKDGAHAMACGEKGHVCSADCHAMK